MAFLDPTNQGDVLLMDIRKQNGKAYMLLSLSISPSDTITFNAVQNAVTTDLPSGDAKQAWKNICEINQPATKADQHDLEQQFNHGVLQDETQNPDKLFSKLEKVRILLKLDHQKTIDDDTMITQLLYNTNSKHYDTMVTFLKLEITMIGSTKMGLEDVKKVYRTVHVSIKQNHTRDRKNKAALFTRNGAVTPGRGYSKVFKVDCRTCGQKCHKSANGWENQLIKTKGHPIGRVKIRQRRHI
jgi:hypothetical protein